MPRHPRPRALVGDLAAGLAVGIATAAYLLSLPLNLGHGDESFFLYEAKRLRDGEVMYRDVFQFVTPLSSYLMAGAFWLFGTTLQVARTVTALLHAAVAVGLYTACRQLDVRRLVALLVPVAYLATCPLPWPYASWHWFATTFIVLLLVVLLRVRPGSTRGTLAIGLVAGALVATQQQKGAVFVATIVVLFAIDHLARHRRHALGTAPALLRRLVLLAAGILLIVGPILGTLALAAGPGALWEALVRFPLESYRPNLQTTFGGVGSGFGFRLLEFSFPTLLTYSPLAVLLPAGGLVTSLRRGDATGARRHTALMAMTIAAPLSVWYYPSFIHLAFGAGLAMVCVADGLEGLTRTLERRVRVAALLPVLVVVGLLIPLGQHLVTSSRTLHARFAIRHPTAFGVVDFEFPWHAAFVDAVRAYVGGDPPAEMFCYPEFAGPYLTTGGRNPTPYQAINAKWSPPRQLEHAVAILRERRTPFIVFPLMSVRGADPIAVLLGEEYELLDLPTVRSPGGARVPLSLFRRR